MAMVRAKRNGKRIKVSRSAFENIFQPMGYVEIGKKKNTEKVSSDMEFRNQEEPEEQNKEVDLDTIPISDMTKEQLAQYAKNHNIDTSGAKSVSEARKIIQSEVRKRNNQ